ncbi:hypothetical protein [Salinimicrobium soli]|uniref:hypothetical protein n=1 Tax=Salinimicrobium soli TaxID=1254399 RepID=UPI003AAAB294
MKRTFLLLIFPFLLWSCNSANQEGKLEDGVYTYEKLDWEIEIPEGYSVRKAQKNPAKKGAVNLVSFEIDPQNYFASSVEPLKNSKKLTPQQHQQFLAQVIKESYSLVEGVEIKQDLSKELIGNFYFYTIETKVLDSKTHELVLAQRFYNTYLEDREMFSVLINYTSEEVDSTLTENFKRSLQKA